MARRKPPWMGTNDSLQETQKGWCASVAPTFFFPLQIFFSRALWVLLVMNCSITRVRATAEISLSPMNKIIPSKWVNTASRNYWYLPYGVRHLKLIERERDIKIYIFLYWLLFFKFIIFKAFWFLVQKILKSSKTIHTQR